jgi:hypothetical protein
MSGIGTFQLKDLLIVETEAKNVTEADRLHGWAFEGQEPLTVYSAQARIIGCKPMKVE